MHQLTLEQFRTTAATGAVLSVTLRAQGAKFYVQAETRRGDATLITERGKTPRGFANPIKALALLRELGIRESRVETTDWRPEEAEMTSALGPTGPNPCSVRHYLIDGSMSATRRRSPPRPYR